MTEDHPILVYETALVAARLTGDVAALDRLLDDELHFTGLGGQVFTKADDLAAHRSGHLRITKMRPVERHIISLGPVTVDAQRRTEDRMPQPAGGSLARVRDTAIMIPRPATTRQAITT